jgi:predicted phage terminase large subunit-like protein
VQLLEGFTVSVKRTSANKIARFGPVSTQANPESTGEPRGRFRIVRGSWNEELLNELEAFPLGAHDDIVDALSDAFDELQGLVFPEPIEPFDVDDEYRFGRGRGFG